MGLIGPFGPAWLRIGPVLVILAQIEVEVLQTYSNWNFFSYRTTRDNRVRKARSVDLQ